jgi:hypothetical protein
MKSFAFPHNKNICLTNDKLRLHFLCVLFVVMSWKMLWEITHDSVNKGKVVCF